MSAAMSSATLMFRSGGGARSAFWRHLQADMYNTTIVTPNVTEGAALGVAILAAVGTGAYKSVSQACRRIVKPVDPIRPAARMVKLYDRNSKTFGRLYEVLKAEFPKLAKLV